MIAAIIDRFYAAVEKQQALGRQVTHRGLQPSQVPSENLMLAYAALGDHDRAGVMQKLSADSWQALEERAIVRGEMSDFSTPELRLLTAMLPALLALPDLDELFEAPAMTNSPEAIEVIRVRIKPQNPLWGQPVRLEYELNSVAYVRIRADDVFMRRPLTRYIENETECRYIELPADNGDVVFTLLMRDGRVLEHRETLQLPTWEEDCAHER